MPWWLWVLVGVIVLAIFVWAARDSDREWKEMAARSDERARKGLGPWVD